MLTKSNTQPSNAQLAIPLNAIVFDCDGTLSSIEGIDELARQNNVGPAVEALTAVAMGKTGINPDLYEQRLKLVAPTHSQVLALGDVYFEHCVPDCHAIIQIFLRLNKDVFVVSAGLKPSVTQFSKHLNISPEKIFAVDISFNKQGEFLQFDRQSPLTQHDGKLHIMQTLREQYPNIAHIGDGMNDLIARDVATRFVGYGGVFYRKNIESACDFYIRATSLASLLPILLTQDEAANLNPTEKALYETGLNDIKAGMVKC